MSDVDRAWEAWLASMPPYIAAKFSADWKAFTAGYAARSAEVERLRKALAGMYEWQAESVNELMPDRLGNEVRAILGDEIVDTIIYAPSYEEVAKMQASLAECRKLLKPFAAAVRRLGFDGYHDEASVALGIRVGDLRAAARALKEGERRPWCPSCRMFCFDLNGRSRCCDAVCEFRGALTEGEKPA